MRIVTQKGADFLLYTTEREGQLDFFRDFGIDYENQEVLIDHTDGVWNGNLLEFKLTISNLNATLFQSIKYLSRMRIKGEDIPATILLISLNEKLCYVYKSSDYFDDIHQIYYGAASKDNDSFAIQPCALKLDFSSMMGAAELHRILRESEYMPILIDENCIVGWAERYYRENPTANKGDFLGDDQGQIRIKGEIREPKYFKGKILPYTGKTNERFKYLMDKLNDRLQKKDLGAFYTPEPYCRKAAELLRMAIARVPEGNDYIILDRCAGTGNLEAVLTEEELSHCVLSTFEYYEYKVLWERLSDKVRLILPPVESQVEYAQGLVRNADAMSQEYIENPLIRQYVDDPKCTIILYENPPYRDATSNSFTKSTGKIKSFVVTEMKKEIKGSATNELANQFIWSGFQYYLREPSDSYIIFSPVKYFKSCRLADFEFGKGFLFNRKYFHATASSISCILWHNIPRKVDQIVVEVYDIEDEHTKYLRSMQIKKVEKVMSDLYDSRSFEADTYDGICCELDGTEKVGNVGIRVKKIYNSNIVAYLRASSFNLNALSGHLMRCGGYDGNGFFIRSDNYLTKLPLFAAKMFPQDIWYERDVYFTTADGGDAYTHDQDFLMRCLIFTCLSRYNKCLSFVGSDGRTYLNELCFDDGTLASQDLSGFALNADEQELMQLWQMILQESRRTAHYDDQKKYGPYQIESELNTYREDIVGSQKRKIYDYPSLNGNLIALKVKLKAYYLKYLKDKLFEYQLLK